jgi:transcriptional regulator with XRE-family HTH domain
MPPKRMSGKQLRALRTERGETLEEFGAYLAKIAGAPRPYTRQEVNAWESEREYAEGKVRRVPLAVELALTQKGIV